MRNIGLDVQAPTKSCTDPQCPFHGTLPVRGQVLEGRVANLKMEGTVIVERERNWYLPKFERYEKRTSRYAAHHPPCIDLSIADHVKIAECRPLSKTVAYVVVEARFGKREVHGEDVGAPVIERRAPEAEEADEASEDEAAPDETPEEADEQ